MADSLADLQNTAQGNTLGDIQNTTGATPTTIGTAQSLGAVQNSAQMVGTPQQQKAAVKEALSPKNTLAELQRTMTGRTQAKTGQSSAALESLEAAKAASGLAGKIGAATTAAVSKANIALDVSANIDSLGKSPEEVSKLKTGLADLVTKLNAGEDVTKLVKELGGPNAVAGYFNVDPAVLWGKVESQIPKNTLVKDLFGIANQSDIDTVRSMLPESELSKFDNMTWEEAKGFVNQKLNDSISNVSELQRQASDRTLPASTRALAVQRLRELGMTGEYQAAEEIKTAQQVIEDADNVYIDGQAYEASEVLNSPEAKALITDILTGAKDLSALKGTPFEGLESMVRERGEKLAEYFGIEKGQLGGFGKIQAAEQVRKENQDKIDQFFKDMNLTPSQDKNVLSALGITEDMLNGYTTFDPAVVQQNKMLNTVLSLPEELRVNALSVLAVDGANSIIGDDKTFLELMKTKAGQERVRSVIKASNISKNLYQVSDDKDDTFNILSELGVPVSALEGIKSLAGTDIRALGGSLPEMLDSDKDGKVDDFKQVEQRLSTASMSDLDKLRTSIDPNSIQKAVLQRNTDETLKSKFAPVYATDTKQLTTLLPPLKSLLGSFNIKADGGINLSPVWGDMMKATPTSPQVTNTSWQQIGETDAKISSAERSIKGVLESVKSQGMSQQAYAELEKSYAPLLQMLDTMKVANTNRRTQKAIADKNIAELKRIEDIMKQASATAGSVRMW